MICLPCITYGNILEKSICFLSIIVSSISQIGVRKLVVQILTACKKKKKR